MNGTGGGFVFRTMKPEFCVCDYLPHHCFAFDLEATGGAWLDAPYYLPAGSTVKEEFSLAGRPTILSRAAQRDAIRADLGAQGLSDRIERETEARIAYREWVTDACTPAANQTAVTTNDGQRLSCTIYSKTSIGYAREVVSAAVAEVPQ